MGELEGRVAQALDLGPALGADREVLLEAGPLEVVDRIDRVGAGKGVDVVIHDWSPNVSRNLIKPSRIRVFAVPRGRSSMVATSEWV